LAGRQNPSFLKRQKEQKRREKAEAKRAARQARRAGKAAGESADEAPGDESLQPRDDAEADAGPDRTD
jgi:hypothetical protein